MTRLLMLALWLGACGQQADPVPAAAPAPAPVLAQAAPASVLDMSLYQLDVPLFDQAGRTTSLRDQAGHPVVVAMFYATCKHTCPTLIQRILAFEDSVDPKLRDDLRVLLISFAQDSPDVLMDVVERHGLDTSRWTLTRTEPERVRELAALLDVTFRTNPEGGFNHSSGFTLVDAEGVIRAQLDDMNADPTPLHEALAALSGAASNLSRSTQ